MNRREVVLALISTGVAPLPALAQAERSVRRIGFLGTGSAPTTAQALAAFREGMAELRLVEGRDYLLDTRFSNGVAEATVRLADELVAIAPNLLLSTGELAVRSLAAKTKTIPIVFTVVQDPVTNGFAASLRRPGGNITGLTTIARELGAKRLQLLKDAVPRIVHVVLLFEPDNAGSVGQMKDIEAAASRMGMRTTAIELRQPKDVDAAFNRTAISGVYAYMVIQGGITLIKRQEIIDQVNRLKVAAMFPDDQYVERGGLISYGASIDDNYRRAAAYVESIFKGANPGDLPIQQPTKFELVVNTKTAKAIGVTLPQSILLRADRMIE
jgi:putative tryptophan/tyrosine transport system substrate-binding protein